MQTCRDIEAYFFRCVIILSNVEERSKRSLFLSEEFLVGKKTSQSGKIKYCVVYSNGRLLL